MPHLSAAFFAIPLLCLPQPLSAQWCPVIGPERVPSQVSSTTTIAGINEPGDRLHVSGTVYRADGTTPASGVVLFLYQTNARGAYPSTTDTATYLRGAGALHGWVRTGADGSYAVETIRPAPYVGRTVPAHIHMQVMPPGGMACYIDDLEFSNDPLLTANERSRRLSFGGSGVVTAGTHVTRDIVLWPDAYTQALPLDHSASEIRWEGTKFGGRGMHAGTIAIARDSLVVGGEALLSGPIVFALSGLEITDIPRWEPVPRRLLRERLLGPTMFDVERFPSARLEITRAIRTAPGVLRIIAALTIRDVTRTIQFSATLEDPPEARMVATAAFHINRHHWGLAYRGSETGNDLIDDNITFRIRLVGRQVGP